MIPKGNIAILATLDTKGAEVASMRGLLETLGYAATVIDIAPLGPPAIRADLANDEVARQGGWQLEELVRTGPAGSDHGSHGERGRQAPFPSFF